MPEMVVPGCAVEERRIREAVCIHTKKIFDSCKDQDCVEDLRVYPTRSSQEVIDRALSVKAGCAQLLCAYIDVEPVTFNRGYYTVDVRYFYRITADAFVGTARPVEVSGLAVFDKRAVLFGSEGGAKVYSSAYPSCAPACAALPDAVVEAVDPLILGLRLTDACPPRPGEGTAMDIPAPVLAMFGEDLMAGGDTHRLYVTLGQFSIIRLERDTQLLIPAYDYCMPEKECPCGSGCECQEDPCDLFRKVQFPVHQFFPPNSIPSRGSGYQEVRPGSCAAE